MFHLALFSGTEGVLSPRGGTAFVLFGSAELRTPTLAQRLVYARERAKRPLSRMDRLLGRDQWLLITLFGGTEMIRPTLVEELAALRGLMSSGGVSRTELQGLADASISPPDLVGGLSTLTLFGACVVARPSPKKEIAAIDRAAKAGEVDPRARPALESLIGQADPSILRGLSRLALA